MAADDDLFTLFGGTPYKPEQGEVVVRQGPANFWRGAESVGGRLWLTNKRLAFRPHGFNVQSQPEVWPLSAVRGARGVNTLWIVPNGLAVTLEGGRELRFVVWGRAAWMRAISDAPSAGGYR